MPENAENTEISTTEGEWPTQTETVAEDVAPIEELTPFHEAQAIFDARPDVSGIKTDLGWLKRDGTLSPL